MSFECILCDPSKPKQDNSPARVHWHLLKKHAKELNLQGSSLFASKEEYARLLRQDRNGEFAAIFTLLENHTRRLTIVGNSWKDMVLAVFKELEKKNLCNADILGFGHDCYHLEVYRMSYKFAVTTRGRWLTSSHFNCPLMVIPLQTHFLQFKGFCKYMSHTFTKKLEPLFKSNYRKHVGADIVESIEQHRAKQKFMFKQCITILEKAPPNTAELAHVVNEIVNCTCTLIDLQADACMRLFKANATAKGLNIIRDSFLSILHPKDLSQSMIAQILQGCLENAEVFVQIRAVVFGETKEGILLPDKLCKARQKGIPRQFQATPFCRCYSSPTAFDLNFAPELLPQTPSLYPQEPPYQQQTSSQPFFSIPFLQNQSISWNCGPLPSIQDPFFNFDPTNPNEMSTEELLSYVDASPTLSSLVGAFGEENAFK